MYLLAHATTTIDCPRQAVFDYTANLEHFGEWFPGVLQMTAIDGLAFDAVGKQYRETIAVPLRGQRSVLVQVVQAAAPSRIVTEGSLALVLPRMEMTFRDEGADTCEVEWRMFSRSMSSLARWTILPLVRHLMNQRAQVAMRRLKRRLEAERLSQPHPHHA